MKHIPLLLMVPATVLAGTVFNGYETYYATLPDRLFHDKGVELQPYSEVGDADLRYGWSGTVGGRKHSVRINNGVLSIDRRALLSTTIVAFPDEVVNGGDLGLGSIAYFSPGWACVENTQMSASGTAVRHKAVYLFRLTKGKPGAWKLPSLFASCTGIRAKDGRITFDKIEYRYQLGKDDPVGISLNEYAIASGKFIPSQRSRSATFNEPGNVYKFSIDEN